MPLRRSNRIAARSHLSAAGLESLSADLVLLVALFPDAVDTSLVSLLSFEVEALENVSDIALASLPSPSHLDLNKSPVSYAEACTHPDSSVWRVAMDREIASLREMDAFGETALPPGKKPLDLKWVYAHKTDAGGKVLVG
jgi:hypothetical protein